MRMLPIVATIAAAFFLSACDDKVECTPELAQTKATELTNKLTEMMSSDPEKVVAIAPKMQEIAEKMAAGGDDMSEACTALDEMLAELN